MEITLTGLSRQVYTHNHEIWPLKWCSALRAEGTIHKLVGTESNYWMRMDFKDEELENWIESYIREDPDKALRLLAKMHAEASIAVAKHNRNTDD